eukprot:snap_masked-scaffold_94-processed-gene-0.17-mRNA-1 protein AED:1.00 eAED:1.00 QI:0/0/0/0/1/1/2/0/79
MIPYHSKLKTSHFEENRLSRQYTHSYDLKDLSVSDDSRMSSLNFTLYSTLDISKKVRAASIVCEKQMKLEQAKKRMSFV